MSETVIRVRHLSYAYGEGKLRRQVLFDLQGEIRESEIVIVKGPSGPPPKNASHFNNA
ncbi:MAG: hypothetical protein P4L55_14580 [Syntrophobacteraceae bacterium]|nr:hypothetical protein [Syntrophobacteraceae bacterium]